MNAEVAELLEGYQSIPFPRQASIVYVIGINRPARFVPVYVGESGRNMGRFGDYISAQFSAQTDFKVGEAVRYLWECGLDVAIRYKAFERGAGASDDEKIRRAEQNRVIRSFEGQGFQLVNSLKGYDYRIADRNVEAAKVRVFLDSIMAKMA